MKKTILIFVLNIIYSVMYGQSEIFRDDFNNNFNRWSEVKRTYSEHFFRGGQYYIINNAENRVAYDVKKISIDQNKDFFIATSVALNWEKDGSAFLVFGADRNGNFHFLNITKGVNGQNGKAYIGKVIDGEWVGVWKDAEIKDFGEQNVLTIEKIKNTINYSVNLSLVHSKNIEPFFGNNIGVGCQGPQNISFDYIFVKQDKTSNTNNYVYETQRKYNGSKTEVELKKKGGVYEIPVELNQVLKIDFIFDSGASDVSISPDVAMTLIKTGTIKDSDWLPGAYYKFADGTTAKSLRFKLNSVKIGNKVVNDVTCSISNSIEAPMLLGQSVLSKFGSYTFDYKNNKLIIE